MVALKIEDGVYHNYIYLTCVFSPSFIIGFIGSNCYGYVANVLTWYKVGIYTGPMLPLEAGISTAPPCDPGELAVRADCGDGLLAE